MSRRAARARQDRPVPDPTHTLIQFTDLHLGADGEDAPRNDAAVAHALQAVVDSGLRPAALLFTGDLADHGAPEEYQRLRALVEPVAARLGAPAVYVAGNHDDRAALRRDLLGAEPSTAPFDHVVRLGDLRIVVLDSTVPGHGYGALRPEQLDWLRAELAEPAPAGTVLALHHPPLPTAVALSSVIELQNPDELAAAIDGAGVRIVLAGHTHVVSAGALAGVPVWTGGALSTTFDGLAPDGELRGLGSPAVSRIELFPGSVLATTVPTTAPVVGGVPADQMAATVARLRAELPGR
jgi:3',5'-cyclic-AMP phosphodiesterase